MIRELKNRLTHLFAVKTDAEIQGDFIKFLKKEVEIAAFTGIEDFPFAAFTSYLIWSMKECCLSTLWLAGAEGRCITRGCLPLL
ncbi:hypothetical protein OIU77_021743 [Salix suchowensis]|uniref:Uncharacterized protein n=1 Tax=Salix suchowensis TaxID=1278906 RepID=A0ABQ9CES0_9ROSI|nr:hypothetical protein OIU77_021743 [Salix suchowensis]